MKIKCLASGSTGNCYLVTLDSGSKFILDAGININTIVKEAGPLNDIDFVFYSHKHNDHYKSIEKLRNRGLLIMNGTNTSCFAENSNLGKFISKYQIFTFPVEHGECENYGVVVRSLVSDECLLYCTDFTVCKPNLSMFKFTNIMVECNYYKPIAEMQDDYKTKRQINTHMDLEGCCIFLSKLNLSWCKEILLVHQSQTLGDPIIFGSYVYSKFRIKTGVCKQYGGIDYYGC